MKPAPGRILVKPVETAETLAGGKIILTQNTLAAWTFGQAEVVAVGPPQSCTDDDCARVHLHGCHPTDARLTAGAWILCRPRRFVEANDGQWLVMDDDVVGIFTAPAS